MIDIITTPKENEVFQNSAPIPIHVRSLLGADYYFTLTILVNGEEYDVQTVSKKNEYDGEIDLQDIIQSVFEQEYTPVTTTQVVQQTELLKSIQLTIKEYSNLDNTLSKTLDLPLFYVINSSEIEALVLKELTSLSIYSSTIKTPVNGLLQIPFFANQTFSIAVYKNEELVKSIEEIDAFGVYNFQLNLSEIVPNSTRSDIRISIISNSIILEYIIEFVAYQGYEPTLLAVQNNFNAWENYYAFGNTEEADSIVRKTSVLSDYENHTYSVISKPSYKVNTGYYNTAYKTVINKVAKAYRVLYYYNNEFLEAELKNKKSTPILQRENIYDTSFDLVKNQTTTVNNSSQFIQVPTATNFNVNGVENTLLEVSKELFLNNFNATPTAIRFTEAPFVDSVNIVLNGISTPIVVGDKYYWTDFDKIELTPTGYGSPYTFLKFIIKDGNYYSNTATVSLVVAENDPNNLPPEISMPSEAVIYHDKNSTTITAIVTEPENEDFTLLWTQESGQQITLNNYTTPSLTLSNWVAVGEYEFKLTATDVRGNAASKNLILKVMDYKINVAINYNSIIVYGGKPGETVSVHIVISNTVEFSSSNRSVPTGVKGYLYGLDINNVNVLTAQGQEDGYYNGAATIIKTDDLTIIKDTFVFDDLGEIKIPITRGYSVSASNGSADNVNELKLNLKSSLDVSLHSKGPGVEYGNQTSVKGTIVYFND